MNVLILGSGGREHALCYVVSNSKSCKKLYAIPGNPGMKKIAECVNIDPMDNDLIKSFVQNNKIDLIIPGSEVYLENGITDTFLHTDVKVFGPTKAATMIESSKEFAKDLMKKYNIPTAKYEVFSEYTEAKNYVDQNKIPIVIKYDGLAGGKGVVVALTKEEAYDALYKMLVQKVYGNSNVIIEEFLTGPEFSLMCFVKDDIIIPMPIAQDHKRLLDNDRGPNTGGMGIYSSVPIIDQTIVNRAMNEVMLPTVKAMVNEGKPFTGFLYGGLMNTNEGPKVIEFNARFGDPEAEVILPKLETDFLEIITNLYYNKSTSLKWSNDFYVGVVMASKGYPIRYTRDHLINGVNQINDLVFHMGTKQDEEGLKTNGGRVLLITGKGKTLKEAQKRAYLNLQNVKCDNLIYRTDIGNKSLK